MPGIGGDVQVRQEGPAREVGAILGVLSLVPARAHRHDTAGDGQPERKELAPVYLTLHHVEHSMLPFRISLCRLNADSANVHIPE